MKSVAIIGCGKHGADRVGFAIGHAHAEAWKRADPSLRLLTVDPSAENLANLADRFDVAPADRFAGTSALYAAVTPDFVSVCTWPGLHASQAKEAIAAGVKWIVCEKPMAADIAEVREMLAASRKAGAQMAIPHQRCFNPMNQLARRLIVEGAIGDGLILEGRVAGDWDILAWTVHWFDLARFLLDSKPVSVLAGCDVTDVRRYNHAVENASTIFVEFDNGAQASFITGPKSADGTTVCVRGSRGLMRIGKTAIKLYTDVGYRELTPDPDIVAAYPRDFVALMKNVLAAADGSEPLVCDAEHCHLATEVAYAAHESARARRRISLPMDTLFAPLEVLQHASKPVMPPGPYVLCADNHPGRDGIAEALLSLTRQPPTVLDATQDLTDTQLSGAGVLMLYHTHHLPSEATQAALRNWVRSGRPLLLIHAAIGAYPQWDEYKRWCGRVWVWGKGGSTHPHEPCTLAQSGLPDLPWNTGWLPRDEVFIRLADTSRVEDLVTAKIPHGEFPAAWRSVEHRNIATWVPGHRSDSWRVPAMREGLAAMLRLISG